MPDWRPEVRRRLERLALPPEREADIVEELAAHLDDRYRSLLAAGATEPDARRRVLEELTGDEALAARLAAVEATAPVVEAPGSPAGALGPSLWQDVRYALRTFRRQPGFTATAVIMLALCTGANTAMFSVVHAVLFSSSYRDPSAIMTFMDTEDPARRAVLNAGPDEVDQLRGFTNLFESVAAFGLGSPILSGAGDPRRVQIECVSPDMFRVLGIEPALGRPFTAEDDRPGAAPVLVVSDAFWRAELEGRADAVGRTVTLNGNAVTVIGVMPPAFDGVRSMGTKEAWAPLEAGTGRESPSGCLVRGGSNVYARLKSGLTVASANERLSVLTGGTRQLVSLTDSTVGDDRAMLLALFGAVGFVLLIGCANVANLLLGRAIGRRREIATRLALGASVPRIVRQLLTESVLLALAGTAAGLLVAAWSLAGIVALVPRGIPRVHSITIDATVLIVSIAAGAAAGLVAGLVPALQSRSRDLRAWLSDARGATNVAGSLARRALVVAEVALSVALVIGATLTVRTFLAVRPVNPGFDATNKTVVSLHLSGPRYQAPEARRVFADELVGRLAGLPGVEGVSLINFVPFSGSESAVRVGTPDQPAPATPGRGLIQTMTVSPNYFAEMRIAIARGRSFVRTDAAGAPPVAIVSEELARRLWPDREALGQVLAIDSRVFDSAPKRVVGVVANVRTFGSSLRPQPQLYVPYAQEPYPYITAVIRSASAGLPLAAVRHEAAGVDRSQVVSSVTSLDSVLSDAMTPRRFVMALMTVMALLALSLAVTGLAAVLGSSVAERTKEIGIRMTLGAAPAGVARLVVGQAARLAGLGVLIGLGLAAATTRFLEESLYGVTPLDAPTFVTGAAIMIAVALVASLVPALRASRVDPLDALRIE